MKTIATCSLFLLTFFVASVTFIQCSQQVGSETGQILPDTLLDKIIQHIRLAGRLCTDQNNAYENVASESESCLQAFNTYTFSNGRRGLGEKAIVQKLIILGKCLQPYKIMVNDCTRFEWRDNDVAAVETIQWANLYYQTVHARAEPLDSSTGVRRCTEGQDYDVQEAFNPCLVRTVPERLLKGTTIVDEFCRFVSGYKSCTLQTFQAIVQLDCQSSVTKQTSDLVKVMEQFEKGAEFPDVVQRCYNMQQ